MSDINRPSHEKLISDNREKSINNNLKVTAETNHEDSANSICQEGIDMFKRLSIAGFEDLHL